MSSLNTSGIGLRLPRGDVDQREDRSLDVLRKISPSIDYLGQSRIDLLAGVGRR